MPRLSEAERHLRRDEIAAAARRCFVRDGYATTSMADIIREADSSAGAVYCHFESKAELLRFVATAVLEGRLAHLRGHLAEIDGELSPAVVAEVLMGAAPGVEDAGVLVQIWAQVLADPELGGVARGTVESLHAMVREALRPWAGRRFPSDPGGKAEVAADAVIAAVHGFVVRAVLSQPSDPDALRDRIVAGLAATTG